MPYLTINGTTIPVQSSNAAKDEDHRQGQIRYAFDGTLLCSLRDPKRVWHFSTRPLTSLEWGSIHAQLTGFGAASVDGDGVTEPGSLPTAFDALVLIDSVDFIQDGLTFQRIYNFSIREI